MCDSLCHYQGKKAQSFFYLFLLGLVCGIFCERTGLSMQVKFFCKLWFLCIGIGILGKAFAYGGSGSIVLKVGNYESVMIGDQLVVPQEEDDFLIIEEVSPKKRSSWAKDIFGNLGTNVAGGVGGNRRIFSGIVGLDKTIGRLRLYVSGGIISHYQKQKQKLVGDIKERLEEEKNASGSGGEDMDMGGTMPIEGEAELSEEEKNASESGGEDMGGTMRIEEEEELSEERVIDTKGTELTLDEAYGQLSIGEKLLLRIGRQRIVLGQFLVFSPVNFFVLPARMSGTSISHEKVNFRYPQDGISFAFFPTEKMEIQGYLFRPRYDELVQKAIEMNLVGYGLVKTADGIPKLANEDRSFINGQTPYELKASSVYARGARVLLYHQGMTLGATIFKGVDGYTTHSNATLKIAPFTSTTEDGINLSLTEKEKKGDDVLYLHSPALDNATMSHNAGIGVEFSYQKGKWVLIGEYTRIYMNLDFYLGDHFYDEPVSEDDLKAFIESPRTPDDTPEGQDLAQQALYHWIKNSNDKKMYLETKVDAIAVGIEYHGKRLSLSAGVGWLLAVKGKSQDDKKGYTLAKYAGFVNSEEDDAVLIVPAVAVLYNANASGTVKIGGAFGIVGLGTGVGLTAQFQFQERLQLAINWHKGDNMAGFFLEKSNSKGGKYERAEEESNMFSLVAVWKF